MELTLSLSDERIAGDAVALRDFSAIELGRGLYAKGALPVGKAMELAGLTRRQFLEELKARGVWRPFDLEELSKELAD